LFYQEVFFIREYESYVKIDSGNWFLSPQGSVGEPGGTSFNGQFEEQ
jgi:hypothetical protein